MTKYIDYKQLKNELSFPTVLSHYGINHQSERVQDQISCPFHDDDKPSCSVNKQRGMFRCFGCNEQGNVLKFVCLMENQDDEKPEELAIAAKIAVEDILGRKLVDFSRNRKGKVTHNKSSQTTTTKKDKSSEEPSSLTSFNKPLNFELQNLQQNHPEYEVRGVSQEMRTSFGLGYYDQKGMMKGRLVFPIHNGKGELVAYCGRWHDDNPPEGEGKYKLPKGFNKSIELYNQHRAKEMLAEQDWHLPLIIVEGYWSAVRLHAAGYPVVATFGHDLSEKQALLIAQMTEDAIVVYDGDVPGQTGMARALVKLSQYIFVKTIVLEEDEKPDTMDLDQLAISVE